MHRIYLVFLTVVLTVVSGLGQDLVHPDQVIQCLKSKKAAGLAVRTDNNPYYLRGDFDGDGKPDFVLAVRSKSGGTGLAVCTGNGLLFLLGSRIAGRKFSDMPDDNFLAPHWEVMTKKEVAELKDFQSNVPKPVPSTRGEAIAMIWEDGISLIYWDGTKFIWAGSKE